MALASFYSGLKSPTPKSFARSLVFFIGMQKETKN